MTKMLQLTAMGLLVSGVTLSLPLLADTLAPPPTVVVSPSETLPYNSIDNTDSSVSSNLRFTLQHRFNGGNPLPKETIVIPFEKITMRPPVVLEKIIQNFSKHLEKQTKPVRISTEVDFWLPTEVTKVLGKLPTLFMITNIDSNGVGKSDLQIPPEKRQIKDGKTIIDWKGLNGKFTFTDNFKSMGTRLNFAGLTINTEDFSLIWGNTTFSGALNAFFTFTELDLNLPTLTAADNDNRLNLRGFALKFNTETTEKGLGLGNAIFRIGHFDFSDKKLKSSLDNLLVTGNGKEQNGIVNYVVQSKIRKLVLPYVISNVLSEISYEGNLAFRRLDAEALLALQKTTRELSNDNPMAAMILLGKFMEVAPKLVAKSPELAITRLDMKTPNGENLQGSAHINFDGNKMIAMNLMSLISALQAQANFTVSKNFLEPAMTSIVYNTMLNEMENNKADLAKLQEQADLFSKQQISKLVDDNWLAKADNNNYKLIADFRNSRLIVNGQEKPVPYLSPKTTDKVVQ